MYITDDLVYQGLYLLSLQVEHWLEMDFINFCFF